VTLETRFSVGDKLYVIYVREAAVCDVCGACEGAKTFPVTHADGVVRPLPCAICRGKGHLEATASRPVLDVEKQVVAGLNVHVSRFGGVPTVEYLGKMTTQRDNPTFREWTPRSIQALDGSVRCGAYLSWCWATRAEAKAHAETWQGPLQEACAARFARSGRR
jgi:hypothetical protein